MKFTSIPFYTSMGCICIKILAMHGLISKFFVFLYTLYNY